MAEEIFREFVSSNYVYFNTRKDSEYKDISNLAVYNDEMNTSFIGTFNKYGCNSFQGNIIIDKKIPISALPPPLKKSNPISIIKNMLMTILLV